MPLDPITLLPVAAIVALLSFTGGKKAKAKAKAKPTAQACPPFPALDVEEILATAETGIEAGLRTVEQVTAYVAQTLYPRDVNQKAIPWPKASPWELPPGVADPVVCLFGEIRTIVSIIPIPQEPGPKTTGEILTGLLSDEPTLGKFYLVRHKGPVALGENGVMARALEGAVAGAGTAKNRVALLKLMTTPDAWNWDLYSRTRFTSNWPAYTGNSGRNLGTAWLPRNQGAITEIASGRMPKRTINLEGDKVGEGSSYGLLWIPPLDINALKNLGVVTIGNMKWENGSSVLDPPPELFDLLAA